MLTARSSFERSLTIPLLCPTFPPAIRQCAHIEAPHQTARIPAANPKPSNTAPGVAAFADPEDDDVAVELPSDTVTPRLKVGVPAKINVVPCALAVGTAGSSVASDPESWVPVAVAVTEAPGMLVPDGMAAILEVPVLFSAA